MAGVDSNDVLFGGSVQYQNLTQDLLASCVLHLRGQLSALEGKSAQACCALTLLCVMTGRLTLTADVCVFYGILLRYILTGRAALKGVYRFHSNTLSRLRKVITEQIEEDREAGIGSGGGAGVGLGAEIGVGTGGGVGTETETETGTGTGTGGGVGIGYSYLSSLLLDVEAGMLAAQGGRQR